MPGLRGRLSFSRETIAADAVGGLTSATAAIPDAIAAAYEWIQRRTAKREA